jgi:glutathione S-transferase
MLKIYHAPRTRGFRTIWACEELAIPYEVVPTSMAKKFRASPEWRAMHPAGKLPVMTDGDFRMYESCAMTQYIIDRYGNGRLQPKPGTETHATYLQWCWYAESTFARPIGEVVNHRRSFGDNAIPAVIEEMTGRARLTAEALDGAMRGKDFLVNNEFSGADIMMGYTLMIYELVLEEALPGELPGYWARLASRPGYQATLALDQAQ